MSCLNCNKETEGTQVFCDECLAAMEGYPVPKGTPITIPAQPSPVVPKKQATHLLGTVEEQLQSARKTARRLKISRFFFVLLAAVATTLLVYLGTSGKTPLDLLP